MFFSRELPGARRPRALVMLSAALLGAGALFGAGALLGAGAAPATAAPIPVPDVIIPVGDWPIDLAVSPSGARAYAVNLASATVSVIDTASNTVIATIPVGERPMGAAVSPDGTRVYVSNSTPHTVSVIDATSNTLIDTIAVGTAPSGLVVSPDGALLYVANFQANTVSVVDTAAGLVVATIPVKTGPQEIVVTPDGALLYVANLLENTISVIDTVTRSVVKTIPTESMPMGLAMSSDGEWVYATSMNANFLTTIRPKQNSDTGKIPTPSGTLDVAFSPDNAFAYTLIDNGLKLLVSDVSTHEQTTFDLPGGSGGGLFVLQGNPSRLYVALPEMHAVAALSLVAGPDAPTGVEVTSGHTQAAVTWSAPASDGGNPITGYALQYRVSGDSTWVDGPTVASSQLSAVIAGLTNGTEYEVRVGATNTAGTTWSVSASVTPGFLAPVAPAGVVVAGGMQQAHVSWQASAGAADYEVVIQQGGETLSCSTTGTFCVVTGLEPGAVTVNVVARNAVGQSPASTAAGNVRSLSDVPATRPADSGGASVEFLDSVGRRVSDVAQGQRLTVVASGFAPFSAVDAFAYSTPQHLGGGLTDASGAVQFQVTIPHDLAPGSHSLVTMGVTGSGAIATAHVNVQVGTGGSGDASGAGSLATTGAAGIEWLPAAAAMLLLAGGAAALTARRIARARQ